MIVRDRTRAASLHAVNATEVVDSEVTAYAARRLIRGALLSVYVAGVTAV